VATKAAVQSKGRVTNPAFSHTEHLRTECQIQEESNQLPNSRQSPVLGTREKVTCWRNALLREGLAGRPWVEKEGVVDGWLIIAQTLQSHRDFCRDIIAQLKKLWLKPARHLQTCRPTWTGWHMAGD